MEHAMGMDQHDDEEKTRADEEERTQKLNLLGLSLAKSRSKAMEDRKNSGIEEIWTADEEHYEGIDDANRGSESSSAWTSKPMGQAGIRGDEDTDDEPGSTVFFNITAPYCDNAAAKVGDKIMPIGDDKAFSFKATPVPDLISISQGNFPQDIEKQINEASEFKGIEDRDKVIAKTKDDLIQEVKTDLEEAAGKAKKAETRIHDWLTECKFNASARHVLEDISKVGSGVMKGPIPERRESRAFINGELVVSEEIVPVSRRVNYRNFYPDGACGLDIHDGSLSWERDDISKKPLQELKKDPSYISSQIDECLEEGPHQAKADFSNTDLTKKGLDKGKSSTMYEIWYYYGILEKEDIEAAGCEVDQDNPEVLAVQVIMVNNRVIKAVKNHLSNGALPYDISVWQRRTSQNIPWGIGISRKIRTPQRFVNAGARAMMNNAGLAAGPMYAFLQGLIHPMDGVFELAPRKGWWADKNADVDDIRKAFTFFDVPMYVDDLMKIIELGLKLAEDVTGLPMLLQGQQRQIPDTVGVTQILDANASSSLRRIARNYDDTMAEPHFGRYYDYLLEHGKNDDEKGDFKLVALASSALVERELHDESLMQMGGLVLNPVYGKDPRKWIDEYMRSKKIDPKSMDYDDDKWQEIVENLSQQGGDQAMAVAQFKAEVDERLKVLQLGFDEQEKARDREMLIAVQGLEAELKNMKMGSDKQMNDDDIKASIAKHFATLKLQAKMGGTNIATPLVEPKGRAEEGMAFPQ